MPTTQKGARQQRPHHQFYQEQVDQGYFRPSLMLELKGETLKDPASEYAQELRTVDRKAGYVPHRTLLAYTKKRDKAIRAYELGLAKEDNMNAYLKLAANYAVNDLKDVARKILRRA